MRRQAAARTTQDVLGLPPRFEKNGRDGRVRKRLTYAYTESSDVDGLLCVTSLQAFDSTSNIGHTSSKPTLSATRADSDNVSLLKELSNRRDLRMDGRSHVKASPPPRATATKRSRVDYKATISCI